MKKKNGLIIFILALVVVLLGVIAFYGNALWGRLGYQNINLGLDLRGGVYVVYESVDYTPTDEEMSSAVSMIQQRLDSNQWTEAEVASEGFDRIRVEIPGVEDAETAINEIGQTAHLYFLDEEGNVVVDGANVKDAYKSTSSQNGVSQVVVALEFDSTGAAAFAEATQNNIGKQIYILLDDQIISAPTVNTAILDGSAIITGDFTNEEAQKLANLIKSGSLPFDLRVIESNSIGARLGASSLSTSLVAGLIGIILVLLFMLIAYRGLGFIADWALLIYIGLDILVLSLFEVTLTLPGIAGIILAIGMAVDANVIIFERIKEEMAIIGRSTGTAIKNGFSNALSAIVDGNVTTIIAGIVLYLLGTGTIMGFAQTLIIGIVLSMFTALVITRILVNAFFRMGVTSPAFYGVKLKSENVKETKHIKVVSGRKIWLGISTLVVIVGVVFGVINGASGNGIFNYDIQFTGGSSIEVNIGEDFDQEELEALVASVVEDDSPVIQKVTSENKAIIKLKSVIDDVTTDEAAAESEAAEAEAAADKEAADAEEAVDTEEAADEEAVAAEEEAVVSEDEIEVSSIVSEAEADAEAEAEADEAAVDAEEEAEAEEQAEAEEPAGTEEAADAEEAADTEAAAADTEEAADADDEGTVIDIGADDLIDNGDGTYSISPEALEAVTDEDGNSLIATEEDEATEETTEHVHTVATGEGYTGNIASVIAAVAERYDLEDADFSVTQISATISSEMTRNAILAVFISCIAMLIYVSLRFRDFKTGASSIIALLHDALIVLTCYAVLRIPLSNSFIAAILTVLGYSINASIVIFDRVRENKNAHRKMAVDELVDISVNQCLKRSIFTSLTTLFAIGSLYVMGVQSIKEFALPIVVGIVAGTWSSVLISGSVWYLLSKVKLGKKK
ncbi:MAG: protein translocase subunit SecD [Clostridiales bacterium]|nr:protein translocase subunit SecD [Clostridiales bacterium]